MQKYELMLLLNPNTMDEVDDFISSLKKLISDNKGDLIDTKLLGKRQLAYPINNMNYANYVHLDVNVKPETLELLEEKFIKKSNNNFTLLKDNLFFRNITFQNFQILKMISFLVRDKNWNNYDPKILNYEENFDTSLEYIFDLEYGIDEILKTRNVILFSDNSITLSSEGEFLTDFWTNRIGFNLLIPLQNHVGSNIIVTKGNDLKEEKKFPENIKPDQPFFKFKNLAYTLDDNLLVNINFEGILFEMEDQRNWGDASYKIYSGSLLDPFPYLEKEGANFSQTVKIDVVNKKQRSFPSKNIVKIDHTTPYKFPKIGIKIDSLIIPDDNLINNFDYYYYLIDFTEDFTNVTSRSQNKVFLVALVDHTNDPDDELKKIYNFVTENTINLDKILICPKIYLNSFQPAGEWPKVPELNEYYKIAKKIFSNSEIVSGMVTNFTELNRKRPKMFYDLVSFSFTPIVHDSSDFGVLNTPETIPYILKTLKNFSTLIRAFDKIFILEDTITPRIEETNKTDKALIEYSFERELLYCSESFKTKASLLEIAPSAIFFIFAKINCISASVRFSFDEDIFWI